MDQKLFIIVIFFDSKLYTDISEMVQVIKKNILIVGKTGCGKSTIGNIIFNNSPHLLTTPFACGNGAARITTLFDKRENPNFEVMDSVGFGDPDFTPKPIIQMMDKALESFHRNLDVVIFVVGMGRMSDEVMTIFKIIQEIFFGGRIKPNFKKEIQTPNEQLLEQEYRRKREFSFHLLMNKLEECNPERVLVPNVLAAEAAKAGAARKGMDFSQEQFQAAQETWSAKMWKGMCQCFEKKN
ncbi:hypothetical protein DFA_00539 [Cavenderia fasciculata]|uniref:AIG1-type G domain-containing protein n=1 Tax=Cavenderia fasciculata TaxID=261658 RepID=F4PSD2_CACFS|nr:uncharacterized protein DFA_00539 [Cavenderia fasciculata]EGG20678.1 hypothetical protein DFA_00539 [Cavenderia fasciculata]|eukprot:XP_004358528.1 hypothetical protein DFA_00539 [Cavenderia fasciculata]